MDEEQEGQRLIDEQASREERSEVRAHELLKARIKSRDFSLLFVVWTGILAVSFGFVSSCFTVGIIVNRGVRIDCLEQQVEASAEKESK